MAQSGRLPHLSDLTRDLTDTETSKSILESTHALSADFAIFPINDNPATDVAYGGSHWSLLLCRLREQDFIFYDSLDYQNWHASQSMAKKLAGILVGEQL